MGINKMISKYNDELRITNYDCHKLDYQWFVGF